MWIQEKISKQHKQNENSDKLSWCTQFKDLLVNYEQVRWLISCLVANEPCVNNSGTLNILKVLKYSVKNITLFIYKFQRCSHWSLSLGMDYFIPHLVCVYSSVLRLKLIRVSQMAPWPQIPRVRYGGFAWYIHCKTDVCFCCIRLGCGTFV